jgi:hypothetical protein
LTITKNEVAEAVRAWLNAYHAHDIDTILAMEAVSFGFGYRVFAARGVGRLGQREAQERFFAGVDYYHVLLEDFETAVVDDVGMACGVFIEEFQEKGQLPERAFDSQRC